MVLEKINQVNDIKKLEPQELPILADKKFSDPQDLGYRRAPGVESRRCGTYNGNASGV